MRSPYTLTLFSSEPQPATGPSAFMVSIVLHSVLFALLLASMRHVSVRPRRLVNGKYTVRLLDMRETDALVRWFPDKSVAHHGQRAARHAVSAGGKLGSSAVSHVASISRNFDTQKPMIHTMIQPDAPPDVRMPDMPIPQAMVWTAGEIKQRKIVPPAPQTSGAIQVKPSLRMPNHELTPTEMSLSASPFITEAPMPAPGTTSPVVVRGAEPAKQLPETASKDTAQVSPARVVSTSDLKVQEGPAALPLVNEIALANAPGTPMPGRAESMSRAGDDTTDSKQNGAGSGHGTGNEGDNADGVIVQDGSGGGSSSDDGVSIDTGSGGAPSSGTTTVEHITLPKNGQYGMVVVGASPQENYPETAGLWAGRMVYTVYLQTDTSQNWILQYSVPRSKGADPSDDTRPDAPWPYDMMRPSLGSYKDIVLVHGFVNALGRFEQVSVVYPVEFTEAGLLLRALKQWEFRPAMSQGQAVAVEVLLIVPGEAE